MKVRRENVLKHGSEKAGLLARIAILVLLSLGGLIVMVRLIYYGGGGSSYSNYYTMNINTNLLFVPEGLTKGKIETANINGGGAAGPGVSESASSIVPLESKPHIQSESWCDRVRQARTNLHKDMIITYPCEQLQPTAKSVVVCMLTAGTDQPVNRTKRVVFTARQYVEGAMALGYSVQQNIDTSQTHMLLLIREGFELPEADVQALTKVGWTIGTAPDFPLEKKYVPKFPRYKTTYTKVAAIGLAEYQCALLLDADILVTGDLKDLMTCTSFTQPQHQLAATIDHYSKSWYYINTGSLLWKTGVEEMNRVYAKSKDPSFMKQYSSDQEFLNYVYPDRITKSSRPLNTKIMEAMAPDQIPEEAYNGQIVPLGFGYNAQTHVEVENPNYWKQFRSEVKIIHYTQKKGWQCPELYEESPSWEDMPTKCDKSIPICYCREGHLYWKALRNAKGIALAA